MAYRNREKKTNEKPEKIYLLRGDRLSHTRSSVLGYFKNSTPSEALKGSLFKVSQEDEQPDDVSKVALVSMDNPQQVMEASLIDLQLIESEEVAEMLLAIPSTNERYLIFFSNRGHLQSAQDAIVGHTKVEVDVNGQPLRGLLMYKGKLKKLKGIHFGVALDGKEYTGEPTKRKRGARRKVGDLFQRFLKTKSKQPRKDQETTATSSTPGEGPRTQPSTSKRGRGRGRGSTSSQKGVVVTSGRGKGRGRGRGRGRGKVLPSIRLQRKKGEEEEQQQNAIRIEGLLQNRNSKLEETINRMDEPTAKALLLKVCKSQPGLVFSLYEDTSDTTISEGFHPPSDAQSPLWCTCGNCREMPSVEEQLCCKCKPENCVSTLPELQLLVLEPMVVTLANNYRSGMLALTVENEEDRNKSMRHGAYRQYILWRYGYLGEGNRRVIPSCVVWCTRDSYKSKYGQYTGYKPGRLA